MRGQDLTEFEAEFESTLLSLRALLNSLAEDAAKKRGARGELEDEEKLLCRRV